MGLSETRRTRLNQLINEAPGNQTEFANSLSNVTPNYLGQLKRGDRPIGEKKAREIEHDLKLSKYYLDGDVGIASAIEDPYRPSLDAVGLAWCMGLVDRLADRIEVELARQDKVLALDDQRRARIVIILYDLYLLDAQIVKMSDNVIMRLVGPQVVSM